MMKSWCDTATSPPPLRHASLLHTRVNSEHRFDYDNDYIDDDCPYFCHCSMDVLSWWWWRAGVILLLLPATATCFFTSHQGPTTDVMYAAMMVHSVQKSLDKREKSNHLKMRWLRQVFRRCPNSRSYSVQHASSSNKSCQAQCMSQNTQTHPLPTNSEYAQWSGSITNMGNPSEQWTSMEIRDPQACYPKMRPLSMGCLSPHREDDLFWRIKFPFLQRNTKPVQCSARLNTIWISNAGPCSESRIDWFLILRRRRYKTVL